MLGQTLACRHTGLGTSVLYMGPMLVCVGRLGLGTCMLMGMGAVDCSGKGVCECVRGRTAEAEWFVCGMTSDQTTAPPGKQGG